MEEIEPTKETRNAEGSSEQSQQDEQDQKETTPSEATQQDAVIVTDPSPSGGRAIVENGTGGKTVTPPTLPLDWTKLGQATDENEPPPKRYPHDVGEIDEEEDEIVIVGTAGQKITLIGDDFSEKCNPRLSRLVLRSHMIKKMEGLDNFTNLELLELYDNMVEGLSSLEGPGQTLRTLDMSYNAIRDMSPVSLCPNLKELYLANNKLKTIEGLGGLKSLVKIDLGANRIRVMDEKELSSLVNLEELWIGKNKIEEIRGLEKLTKLRRLDVQSNRLLSVENLQTQEETLEELYLAHNGIDTDGASKPTGLGLSFPKLNVLDLSRNRLTSTAPFAHLEGLDELWLSGNEIATFDGVEPLKKVDEDGKPITIGQQLETIYLEHNPVSKEFEYRKRLAEWIPSLQQIDANMIGGIGAHGMPSSLVRPAASAATKPAVFSEAEMLRLQEMVIQRAKNETETKNAPDNK